MDPHSQPRRPPCGQSMTTLRPNMEEAWRRPRTHSLSRCPNLGRRRGTDMVEAHCLHPLRHPAGDQRVGQTGSAPGHDAASYDILGMIGEKTAGIMASTSADCCAGIGTQGLPRIWAESVLSLIPEAGNNTTEISISGRSVSYRFSRQPRLTASSAKRARPSEAGRST